MKHLKEIHKYLSGSFKTCGKNPLFILSSFFVDILFFFLFGIIYSFFSSGIMEHLVEVNVIIGEINSKLAVLSAGIEDNAVLTIIMAQQEVISAHVKSIAILAAGVVLSTYILWNIFQGINWHLASWVNHRKKHHFLKYLGKFSLLNLVWLVVLALIAFATYKISVYNTMAKIAIVGQNTINYFMLFLAAVLFYFAVVSYSFSAKETFFKSMKKTFVCGFWKAKLYVPAYLFIALLIVVIYYIISLLRLDITYSVPLNLLFMLPVFAYGRVLFLEISGDIIEKPKVHKKRKKSKRK